jgi:hypothetical protein
MTAARKLSLWGCEGVDGACNAPLVGKDSGLSGTLVVKVLAEPNCAYQVDVDREGKWYSGFKATLPKCGSTTTSSSSSTSTTLSKAATTSTTARMTTTTELGASTTTIGPSTTGVPPSTPPSPPSTTPPLAFTGVGVGLMGLGVVGGLMTLTGGSILIYTRRRATGG